MATTARTRAVDPVPTTVAAYVAGVSEKVVRQAVERAEIRPARHEFGQRSEYLFALKDLVYLRLRNRIRGLLGQGGRRSLYEAMSRHEDELSQVQFELEVGGMIYLRINFVIEEVMRGLKEVSAAEELVTLEPGIRGGEPVVKGTRVPVYLLAELQAKGAYSEEILADYPSLTPESLEAAVTWARLHPKRGRPASGARWREKGGIERRSE
jgi:uncharacterized protein (DUF433 family)